MKLKMYQKYIEHKDGNNKYKVSTSIAYLNETEKHLQSAQKTKKTTTTNFLILK